VPDLPSRTIIDISLDVGPDMLTWPGDPPVSVEPAKRMSRGDSSNVSELRLGSHTGTHVDPPFHFLDDGVGVDALPLDALCGPAKVADLTGVEGAVGADALEGLGLPPSIERLLLRTSNSELWSRQGTQFPDAYVALDPSGARWVVDHGIRLVGIDFLSIEARGSADHPVHRTLLSGGTVILEGLDLSGAAPGSYELLCLPLKVVDGDGAPARAALIPAD
jgi:arylformamidase